MQNILLDKLPLKKYFDAISEHVKLPVNGKNYSLCQNNGISKKLFFQYSVLNIILAFYFHTCSYNNVTNTH